MGCPMASVAPCFMFCTLAVPSLIRLRSRCRLSRSSRVGAMDCTMTRSCRIQLIKTGYYPLLPLVISHRQWSPNVSKMHATSFLTLILCHPVAVVLFDVSCWYPCALYIVSSRLKALVVVFKYRPRDCCPGVIRACTP